MKKAFLLIILTISVQGLFAADSETFRSKERRFILELYRNKRYFDTIAEARRLQNNGNRTDVEYFIYTNYFLASQHATVLNSYKPDRSTKDAEFRSLLLISGSYFKTGLYSDSYTALKELQYSELSDRYRFPMFLRRVEPLIFADDPDRIDREISAAEIFLKDNYNFQQLRQELNSYKSDGLKSPSGAAVMSALLPGLGQIYSGRPADGLISLLTVAATAAGGYYIRRTDYHGYSYPLFFFSALFYGGNIYGAYNSAVEANSGTLRGRFNRIDKRYGAYDPAVYIDLRRLFD